MSKKPVLPDFNKIAENALKGLPEFVGEKARAHFLKSFIKEGLTDVSFISQSCQFYGYELFCRFFKILC